MNNLHPAPMGQVLYQKALAETDPDKLLCKRSIQYNLTASFRAMATFASARHFRWANR